MQDLASIYLNAQKLSPIGKDTFVRLNKRNEIVAQVFMESQKTNNDTSTPRSIRIENKQYPYQLDIELLELSSKVQERAKEVFR